MQWIPKRIGHAVRLLIQAYECTLIERVEVKPGIVEDALCFGVGCQQNLESAVEQESCNMIRSNTTSHGIRRFEKLERYPVFVEMPCTGKPCQAAANNKNVRF
jgi:hypothetical protein